MSRAREWDENEILYTAAMRFDGYKYQEERGRGFVAREVVENFHEGGKWEGSPEELLATAFLMERAARFTWFGAEERRDHDKATRALFLETYSMEIPEKYRTSVYQEWMQKFEPHLEECADFVRQIHNNTDYDDLSGYGDDFVIHSGDKDE